MLDIREDVEGTRDMQDRETALDLLCLGFLSREKEGALLLSISGKHIISGYSPKMATLDVDPLNRHLKRINEPNPWTSLGMGVTPLGLDRRRSNPG